MGQLRQADFFIIAYRIIIKLTINFTGGIIMKININVVIITLALIVAGVGSYVLLHGHWATPISEWFVMH